MLWEVNKTAAASHYQHPSVTPINSRHTSTVLSLHYHELSQTLYSGGADSKLTWYNLASGNHGSEFKLGERVSLQSQIRNYPIKGLVMTKPIIPLLD
jgi:hypothetical protein